MVNVDCVYVHNMCFYNVTGKYKWFMTKQIYTYKIKFSVCVQHAEWGNLGSNGQPGSRITHSIPALPPEPQLMSLFHINILVSALYLFQA